MHTIEPFYNWRSMYTSENDVYSPFYGREYSEFEFTHDIYGYYIHPQWDDIGSASLFIKILYTDYEENFAIIELMGEWNDCIQNDIMTFKRDVVDVLQNRGIEKFILIGENVLNYHSGDDCYYEEWFDEIQDSGWVIMINFREHVCREFINTGIDKYFIMGGVFNEMPWRNFLPQQLYEWIDAKIMKKISG